MITEAATPEDPDRLIELDSDAAPPALIADYLKQDFVVLVRNVTPDRVDSHLQAVAGQLGLLEGLRLQASYASLLRHRQRVGEYRMTVNQRSDYQFIPPHCEGPSHVNMQLASFYCVENSTDGGVTLLFNIDESSEVWGILRERVTRIASGSRLLTAGELRRARGLYQLGDAVEVLPDDRIICERPTDISGLVLVDVLARARKTRSHILGRETFAYWVTIAIVDHDPLPFFVSHLQQAKLLIQQPGCLDFLKLDNAASQRIWNSGADYNMLFRCKVIRKLAPGELLLHNNLTWAHSASNWTPESGRREVFAAFA